VIIGGGCMGASVAYHLAQRGVTDVVLVEREETLGAGSTGRNAGGVRHQFSNDANIRLSIESIELFEHFEDVIGSPLDFHQDGYLFLLADADIVAAFERNAALQRSYGIAVDWLSPDDVVRLAPGVSPDGVRAATFCARDGIADPHGVTAGFASAAQRAGLRTWLDTAVTGISRDGQGIRAVHTTRGDIATRVVVNAAGPWAAIIGEMAGVALPVAPLRRHIFLAQPPGAEGWYHTGIPTAPASRIMVIDFESTFYFHREGAALLFGMRDPDESAAFDIDVDWTLLEKIAPVAARRLPILGDAPISHAWAGLYEMTPDAMPIISAIDDAPGLFVIGGFSGHGFQHAPAAGRILADLITGRDPSCDTAPFSASRFLDNALTGEANVV
jgi:sarcosine oxidase subunit beta